VNFTTETAGPVGVPPPKGILSPAQIGAGFLRPLRLTTPEGIACWWGPDGGPVLHSVGARRPFIDVRFMWLKGSQRSSHGVLGQRLDCP